MKKANNLIIVFIFINLQLQSQTLATYTWDESYLLEAKNAYPNNAEAKLSIIRLRERADKLLSVPNVNVTQKSSNWHKYFPLDYDISPNEFVSFSTYFYKDTAVGKTWEDPWIRLEALGINAFVRNQFDYNRLVDMENKVTTTAKAFWFTGNLKYARASVSQLREWFINPKTRMLPQMNHAQFVPFHPTYKYGSAYGIIDAMYMHNIFNSIGLLKTSGEWSKEDEAAMKEWACQFSNWMVNSTLGKKEGQKENNNNHGIYYDVLLITLWQYLDNYNGVDWKQRSKDYLLKFVTDARILYQIGNGQIVNGTPIYGGMFKELTRPGAATYEIMCLNGFNYLAILARKLNIDLYNWDFKGDTRTIKNAIEWVLPFIEGKEDWIFGNVQKNKLLPSNVLPVYLVSSNYLPSHFKLLNNLVIPSCNPLLTTDLNQIIEIPRKVIFYNDFSCNPLFLNNIATIKSGNWQIYNNTLATNNSSSDSDLSSFKSNPSTLLFNTERINGNFSITCRFKLLKNSPNAILGIIFKADLNSSSTNMQGLLFSNTKGKSGLYTVASNKSSSITDKLKAIKTVLECEKVYNLRIVRSGKDVIVKIDNKLIARLGNLNHLKGSVGLISQNANANFLNFRVTKTIDNLHPFVIHSSAIKNDITIQKNENYRINADAVDYDGTVEKVEFYCNGNKIGQSATAPYYCNLNTLPVGKSIISIKATDNEYKSSIVTFSVIQK